MKNLFPAHFGIVLSILFFLCVEGAKSQCNYAEGQFILSWDNGNELIYAHYYNGILYAGGQQAGTNFKPRMWLIATGLVSQTQANCFAETDPTTTTTPPPTSSGGTWTAYNGSSIINTNSGGVVIGGNVNTPSGYKLYVSGGILTEKLRISYSYTSNWADYVFDKNYSLPPLKTIDEYVKKNKHLPGVPSEREVVNNGIEQSEFNIILLKKIEELTLYSIDLEKKIKKIESRKLKVKANVTTITRKK